MPARQVEVVRTVKVETIVVRKLDDRLVKSCDPGGTYRDPTKLPIADLIERTKGLEDCVAILNNDKAELRSLNDSIKPTP